MLGSRPIILNVAQRRAALELPRSLPGACTPLVFFDPRHRGVLDHLRSGNEGARQCGRSELPAMTDDYIDTCCREILKPVDLIAWDSLRPGMGKRTRRRGDYLLILQKPPVTTCTWKDHRISSRWPEKVTRNSIRISSRSS